MWRRSTDIEIQRGGGEIQEADPAVEVERALDLRQVVGADQRLLVDQQPADCDDAGRVHRAEARQNADGLERNERHDMQYPRDLYRGRNAEAHRNRLQALAAVVL